MAVIESIAVSLSNHKHSKSYALSLESVDAATWLFLLWCDRRDSEAGHQTPKPLTLDAAKKKYDKLVAERGGMPCECCGGFYVTAGAPAMVSRPCSSAELADFPTFAPELLEPISEEETDRYLTDDNFSLEEKFDGTRLSVNLDGGVCAAYNRLGGFISVPVDVEQAIRALGCKASGSTANSSLASSWSTICWLSKARTTESRRSATGVNG